MDFIDPLPHPWVLEHCQKEALVIRKCTCEQDWKTEGFGGCWKQTSWELRATGSDAFVNPLSLLSFCLVTAEGGTSGLVFRPLSQLSRAAVLCQRGSQRYVWQVSKDCLRWAPELENLSCCGQKCRVTLCSSLYSLSHSLWPAKWELQSYHVLGQNRKNLRA